jgi:hypothetical protein
MHQNAPKMQQKCTKNAPKCNKNAPKMHQKAPDMPTGWEWKEEGYLIWFSLAEKIENSNVSGFRAKTTFFQFIMPLIDQSVILQKYLRFLCLYDTICQKQSSTLAISKFLVLYSIRILTQSANCYMNIMQLHIKIYQILLFGM